MVTGPYVISDPTPIFYYYTATARLEPETLTDVTTQWRLLELELESPSPYVQCIDGTYVLSFDEMAIKKCLDHHPSKQVIEPFEVLGFLARNLAMGLQVQWTLTTVMSACMSSVQATAWTYTQRDGLPRSGRQYLTRHRRTPHHTDDDSISIPPNADDHIIELSTLVCPLVSCAVEYLAGYIAKKSVEKSRSVAMASTAAPAQKLDHAGAPAYATRWESECECAKVRVKGK
ncbi:hypothetical protein WN55_10569 [Dufourea novaeangliae]|uniref:Uncharacterized protein n=1 Tax=Dufourea novaeangliae TaxID=178035 RepID=A0A154P627_DUFNO|nr:hypothetical protein WN55_10569 [Dufourea novaeangliae]